MCLLRGTDWVFKSDRYIVVLKVLIPGLGVCEWSIPLSDRYTNYTRSPPIYVLCSCVAQHNMWDALRVRMGFTESDAATFKFLFYHHSRSVYGVLLAGSRTGDVPVTRPTVPVCLSDWTPANLSKHPSPSALDVQLPCAASRDNSLRQKRELYKTLDCFFRMSEQPLRG